MCQLALERHAVLPAHRQAAQGAQVRDRDPFQGAAPFDLRRGCGQRGNVLSIRLQPDEGIDLRVTIKEPGPGGMRLMDVPLDMSFAEALGETARMCRTPMSG
jgi:hypothetical protein